MASNGSHGKQFEKDFIASLRSAGHWAERFRDNTWNNMQGSTKSPPDAIAIIRGQPALLELKAVTTGRDGDGDPRPLIKGSISDKRCQGHQLERLLDFQSQGHGKSYVVVLFYTPRAVRRCAVVIPVERWVASADLYGRSTLRLVDLRRDLPASCHMKWVGRGQKVGPYQVCSELGPLPEHDITIIDKVNNDN